MVDAVNRPMIVIVGETASGKSSLSLTLAQQYDGEIICADSWTIYKDMNIGTAKPSPDERKEIPHHLLDLVKPNEPFTAVDFQRFAFKAIEDITKRGKLPIMVGGNGLYVDSVLFNYSFLKKGTDKQRQELNALSIEQLIAKAHEKSIDLTGIDTRNKRRIVRAIESNGQKPDRARSMRANTLVIGVSRRKQELRERIEQRVEKMFAQGLPHEVRALAEKYKWGEEAMKGIGYREFEPYFEGSISKNEVKRRIVRSTVHLAKRQRTWFKKNTSINWVSTPEEAQKIVQEFLTKKQTDAKSATIT